MIFKRYRDGTKVDTAKHMKKMRDAMIKSAKEKRKNGTYKPLPSKVKGLLVHRGSNRKHYRAREVKAERNDDDIPQGKYARSTKFVPGFLRDLDRRSALYYRIKKNFDVIVRDLGGEFELSLVQLTLIEHLVFLMETMEQFEGNMVVAPKKSVILLDKYVKAVNALQSLAKMVGLKKKAHQGGLQGYLKKSGGA